MSTKFEESRRLAIRIPELRKKEFRSKLSFAEQQELDKMLVINAEMYPDQKVEQYADKVRLTAIKNITYKDVTRKASLFQKMMKQENTKEYKIHIMNEEEDLAEYNLQFTFGLEIRQLMEDVGLGLDWPKILPVDDGMCYTDPLEEEDKAWFESFPDPAWCLTKLQEARNLEEKAAAYGIEMVRVIDWLKTRWEKGYQIYADIDPYEEDEWD